MGMDQFAPNYKINGCFVVQNISPQVKTINIFTYPINYMQTRDLLQIPGVAEQDIRASLLKGELNFKIRAKDIIVICSDIDLLQFNTSQESFLKGAGIINGLQIPVELQDITLVGVVNGINTLFSIPSGTFIYSPPSYKIVVYWNGVKQVFNDDYILGPHSNGYSSVILTIPPQVGDVITADYYLQS
jgi:hypothetical protein